MDLVDGRRFRGVGVAWRSPHKVFISDMNQGGLGWCELGKTLSSVKNVIGQGRCTAAARSGWVGRINRSCNEWVQLLEPNIPRRNWGIGGG